jgi:glycosyltransferase involved in cell wall biosynthesis
MTRPLVSCLMPTADRRSFVPIAVDAFLRQDYGPSELIVLDDGADPISDLLPNDQRIRYVRTEAGRSLVVQSRFSGVWLRCR